jgi:hypothetical protein
MLRYSVVVCGCDVARFVDLICGGFRFNSFHNTRKTSTRRTQRCSCKEASVSVRCFRLVCRAQHHNNFASVSWLELIFFGVAVVEQNPPIERVIKLGCVPRLVSFLPNNANPKLQFEAAWALTNIASGNSDQTMVLLQFVCLFAVPRERERERERVSSH